MVEIRATEQGTMMISQYESGEHVERVIDKGNVFLVEDSGSGDRYRIAPANGDLQLIDNDGLIRVARRLENKAQPGDCLR